MKEIIKVKDGVVTIRELVYADDKGGCLNTYSENLKDKKTSIIVLDRISKKLKNMLEEKGLTVIQRKKK